MEIAETPEELLSPPEKRLVETHITQNPTYSALPTTLLFMLLILSITLIYWTNLFGLTDYLPASGEFIFQKHQYWRAVTALMIHADLGHLLSNLYMLSIFTYFVYGYFGFWAFPLIAIAGSTLVNFIVITTYHPSVLLLGASGMVYLLGGFWMSLYLLIQRQFAFVHRLARVLGISLMVFFPTSFEATTSYRSHFIGYVVGAVLGLGFFYLNKRKLLSREIYRFVG